MDGLRVLIVDDEEELVSALEERLNLRGFQAKGVTTGTDALIDLMIFGRAFQTKSTTAEVATPSTKPMAR